MNLFRHVEERIDEFFDGKTRISGGEEGVGKEETFAHFERNVLKIRFFTRFIYLIDTAAWEGETVGIVKRRRMTLNRLLDGLIYPQTPDSTLALGKPPLLSSFNLISLISCTQCIKVFYLFLLAFLHNKLCIISSFKLIALVIEYNIFYV